MRLPCQAVKGPIVTGFPDDVNRPGVTDLMAFGRSGSEPTVVALALPMASTPFTSRAEGVPSTPPAKVIAQVTTSIVLEALSVTVCLPFVDKPDTGTPFTEAVAIAISLVPLADTPKGVVTVVPPLIEGPKLGSVSKSGGTGTGLNPAFRAYNPPALASLFSIAKDQPLTVVLPVSRLRASIVASTSRFV